MFGWLKSKPTAVNTANLRREFDTQIAAIRKSELPKKIAVANGVNMANSIFLKPYRGGKEFQSAGRAKQEAYINTLNQFFTDLQEKGMELESAGVWFFKMWIGSLLAGDEAYTDHVAECLAELTTLCPAVD